uniref:Serine/threonine-protein phosphatase 7 long form-like protein n=1 Tax=Noccaea caerulescens TaxID=107243 RepID=A0A1J3H3W0_NOCCA
MDIDVGPVDPSVLHEQDLHVSSSIWEGQERGLLRCQEHTSLLHQWKLTDEQIKLVDKAGFGFFRKIGPMSLNNSLISALVERWRRETNTFHLPLGEMTITLDEVALVLGLEIDGDPIVGSKVGDEIAMDMCGRLLGKLPSAANKEVNCSRVKLNWLKRTFSECPEDASSDVIKCHTRAYLLYLIGSTIFATTDGDKVSVKYLPLFEDFDQAGRYAWGAAALACLYRALGNASLKSQSNICGCLTLLQCWSYFHLDIGRPEKSEVSFPLALLWKGKGSRSKTDLSEYRREIDDLDPSKITWCPYERFENMIPPQMKAKLILGRSKTTLVCFEKIELHFPDRCLRQFGKRQPIPQKVKRRDRKNRRVDDLDTSMSLACDEWAERGDHIVDSPGGGSVVDDGAYMEWYARISITKLYREAFLESQVMNMIACLREFEEAASGISLERLSPVEREVMESVKDTFSNSLTFGGWQEVAVNSGYGKRRRRNEQTPTIKNGGGGDDVSSLLLQKDT